VALKCKLSCIIHHNDTSNQKNIIYIFFNFACVVREVLKINVSTRENVSVPWSFLFHVALSLCMNLMMMGAPDENFNATTAGINFT